MAELQRLGQGNFGVVYDGGGGVALKLLHGEGIKPGPKRIPYEDLKEEAEIAQQLHQTLFSMGLKALGVPMPYAVLRSGKDLIIHSLVGGSKERDWLRQHSQERPFCDGLIAMERIFGPEQPHLEALRARYYPGDARWAGLFQANRVLKLQLGLLSLPPANEFFSTPCVLAKEAAECLGLDVAAVAKEMGRLTGAARRLGLTCNAVQFVVGHQWGCSRLKVFVLDFGFAKDGRPNEFHDDYYPKTTDLWTEFITGWKEECADPAPVMGAPQTTPLPPPPMGFFRPSAAVPPATGRRRYAPTPFGGGGDNNV